MTRPHRPRPVGYVLHAVAEAARGSFDRYLSLDLDAAPSADLHAELDRMAATLSGIAQILEGIDALRAAEVSR